MGKLADDEYVRCWMRKIGKRFKVGDRVTFSVWADRNGVSHRTKRGVRSGVVTDIDTEHDLSMSVLLDGYKHPKLYHNMFFTRDSHPNRAIRSK